MGSATAKLVSRGPGPSASNSTITLHGRMYHYVNALLPSSDIQPAFLSVYMRDKNFASQTMQHKRAMPKLRPQIRSQLTAMLRDVNPYVQTFLSLRELALSIAAPNNLCMVIHEEL